MKRKPAAFLSYVRSDDLHDDGRITKLRERLEGEVQIQTGGTFPIFQDQTDIHWGKECQARIDSAIEAAALFIPVLTPGFFLSEACRSELQTFLTQEKKLGRSDLVLPIYYVDIPLFNDPAGRTGDALAAILFARQFVDWRDLRLEPFTNPQVSKRLADLAVQIRDLVGELEGSSVVRRSPPELEVEATEEVMRLVLKAMRASEEEPGPRPIREPPTHVVDTMCRGDFPTISAAIDAAKAGDRILVRPGFYEEGIVIEKPLEILGDGLLEEIVIHSKGQNVVLFRTTMGRVSNLTLRQAGGNFSCVDIAQGRLDLEGCDLSSEGNAVVSIHGGAAPRLRRNRIHDGRNSGVVVYENAVGVLEDNEIFGNTLAGVAILEGGNPVLRRNRVYDGKSLGVYVFENGGGVFEDNEIYGNASAGVAITEGGNPVLRRNRIYEGKSMGVAVFSKGNGLLEDNEIFGNALAGIAISEGGDPVLRRNRIFQGKALGVGVLDNGCGVLEDNEIFGNTSAGVEVSKGGNPVLRRNRIHDGKSCGVLVHENGTGVVEDNEIFGNALGGVVVRNGGNPLVRRNKIIGNSQQAICVSEEGAGTFEDNDLQGNARGAWMMDSSSEALVIRRNNQE